MKKIIAVLFAVAFAIPSISQGMTLSLKIDGLVNVNVALPDNTPNNQLQNLLGMIYVYAAERSSPQPLQHICQENGWKLEIK